MPILPPNARALFAPGKADLIFVPTITLLTAFALAPTSTILPVILPLAAIHTYSRIIFPSLSPIRFTLLLSGITIGGALPNIAASRQALSTAPTAFILLILLSSCTSALVVAAMHVEWLASRQVSSSAGRMLLLPAVWSTIWTLTPYISPVGHLLTWSRPNTLDGYRWLIPYFGTSSQNWIAALEAVILSEGFQSWYMASPGQEEEEDNLEGQIDGKRRSHAPFLAIIFLLLLAVPSYFVGGAHPLPLNNVEDVTPFGVGCIIPTFQRYKHHEPTLTDYIKETMKYQNSARFLLWPEGAVTFDSDEERDKAFANIHANITGSYVGVSFEQHVSDSNDSTRRKSLKKTGIAIIGPSSATPYMIYYKRHLVPVVESYQLSHSYDPPDMVQVAIPRPKDVPPSRWGQGGNREVAVTASICLDFALPNPFGHLDSRPGLVLAPARTWEISVGTSMWLQAKERAEELNTMLLWCDGGEGGVSGIAGGGYGGVQQVGPGSWVKSIALEHPFDKRRTTYAWLGDSTVVLYWAGVLLPSLTRRLVFGGGSLIGALRGTRLPFLGHRNPERQPLLENGPLLIDFTS